jgi:stage II sporulation protein GA (sporulation sigma-E factor processing peptidase)
MVWMVVIIFGKMSWKELIRQCITFFLITCFAGGFLNSIYYHTDLRLSLIQLDYSVILSNLPIRFVMIAFLCILPLGVFFIWLRKRYLGSRKEIYDIKLICGEQCLEVRGLLDTGNCLYDPISHRPVIIVENHVMEKIIPQEYRSILKLTEVQEIQKEVAVSQELMDSFMIRFHLIPYRSIGKEQGVMPGIVLDRIQINVDGETICQDRVTAAICNHPLSSGGEYQVILHKELLEGK